MIPSLVAASASHDSESIPQLIDTVDSDDEDDEEDPSEPHPPLLGDAAVPYPETLWLDSAGQSFLCVSDTYVDDGVIQAPHVEDAPGYGLFTDWSLGQYEDLMKLVCGPEAVSTKTPEETCWAPAHVVCGLVNYFEAGAIGLSEDNRTHCLKIVTDPLYLRKPWDPTTNLLKDQGQLLLSKVRSDLGTLVHALNAAPECFPFLAFLIRCLKGMSSDSPPGTPVSPIHSNDTNPQAIWNEFFDDAATLAMVFSSPEADNLLFVTPYENLLPTFEALSSLYVQGKTQIMGTDASQHVMGGANVTRGTKWRNMLPPHVQKDIDDSMQGIDKGPFQYTIGGAELGAAVINELMYCDGEYQRSIGLIDNAGSFGQLGKFKDRNMVARHMLRVVSLKRLVTKPIMHYSLIKSELHKLYDMASSLVIGL